MGRGGGGEKKWRKTGWITVQRERNRERDRERERERDRERHR